MAGRIPLALVALFALGDLAWAQAPMSAPRDKPAAWLEFDGASSGVEPLEFGPRAESPRRLWAESEYLFWWMQGDRLPPLVTSSPPGTPQASAGVLGAPGPTAIVFGDSRVNDDLRAGGRFTLGYWLDDCRTWGVDASFLLVESQSTPFQEGSNGTAIIARPFLDAQSGLQSSELVSFPGLLAGTVSAVARSDNLYGADLHVRKLLCCDCWYRLEMLAGYRFLRYDENLEIQEQLTSQSPLDLGANLNVTDHFATHNEFHGGDLGLASYFQRGRWSIEVVGKLAIGNLARTVIINGNTVINVPGTPALVESGGLLALSSNSGRFRSDHVAFVPEFGLKAGWQISSHWRATVGYDLLWLTDIARAADQVDPAINTNLLPPALVGGPARPTFTLRDSDIWAQGIQIGLEWRF